MRTRYLRRGATDTKTTIIIVIVVAVLAVLVVLGCLAAVMAGFLLPALGQARESARDLRSSAQLRQINMAYQIWRAGADPDAPFSFDVLVEGDYATADLFVSPIGPVIDGGEDYWLLHPQPDPADPDAADAIIGYDRALYANGRRVATLFGDGTVEILEIADFEQRLRAPPNDQVDFNLPPRRN